MKGDRGGAMCISIPVRIGRSVTTHAFCTSRLFQKRDFHPGRDLVNDFDAVRMHKFSELVATTPKGPRLGRIRFNKYSSIMTILSEYHQNRGGEYLHSPRVRTQ
jgi:hypothetical protein